MLNILSILVGLTALLLALPAMLPFLGALNWLILPIAVIAVGLGVLSKRTSGRNFGIFVLIIVTLRLMLGGGLL